MTGLLLLLLAVVAGALLPVQAGVNARLAHFVGGAVRASLVSFIVGALCLAVIVALFYRSDGQRTAAAPRGGVGGACGAFYVTATLVASVTSARRRSSGFSSLRNSPLASCSTSSAGSGSRKGGLAAASPR